MLSCYANYDTNGASNARPMGAHVAIWPIKKSRVIASLEFFGHWTPWQSSGIPYEGKVLLNWAGIIMTSDHWFSFSFKYTHFFKLPGNWQKMRTVVILRKSVKIINAVRLSFLWSVLQIIAFTSHPCDLFCVSEQIVESTTKSNKKCYFFTVPLAPEQNTQLH